LCLVWRSRGVSFVVLRGHPISLLVCLAVALAAPLVLSAQESPSPSEGATAFVADNVATAANAPDLVQVSVGVPADSGVPSHRLWLPSGFAIDVVGAGLRNPRFMAFDDAGNLLVADAGSGAVYRYPGSNGVIDQTPRPPAPLLSGLDAPSNVALWNGYLYVGETSAISRYPYDAANGVVGRREVVVPDLPRGGHSTRTVIFAPDGWMYVSVGSSCNICDESDERRAAILRFAPDGSGYERFAWGLRNAVGLAIQPGTGLLWATVNERDNQGNEIPPDLVTLVGEGQNFGWPGCQPPNARPQDFGRDCSGITPPTIGIQAHSAPLGLAFNTGQAFPPEYANSLFVVQHGSWNRDPPAEPKLLRIDFEADQPTSARDFLKGWQDPTGARWGRPAGIVVAPDGSLIVSDDQAGLLYRVTFG
jgi:glucose/arabinose dehydrogenase